MKNKILFLLLTIILSSCASIYDARNPEAELRTRSFLINTYNYEDLSYVGENGVVKLAQYMSDVGAAAINSQGKLTTGNSHLDLNIEDEFGDFSSFLSADKVSVASLSINRELMRGWKRKIPFTVKAKNHKSTTIYLKKRLRIGLFLGNIYPFLGVGFPFEKGHLWKLTKEYNLELEPTKNYSEYMEKLAVFNTLLNAKIDSISTSAVQLSVEKVWLIKNTEGEFNIINLASADILPTPSGEISERDVASIQKSINLLKEESLYKSRASAQVRVNILIANKEKEDYNSFMNQEVVCVDKTKKKLVETWFIDYLEDPLYPKSVKQVMTQNLHWMPEEVFSSETSAQNKITLLNEETKKAKEEEEKEYQAYLNEVIICADGASIKRKNIQFWFMNESKKNELIEIATKLDNYKEIKINKIDEELNNAKTFFKRNPNIIEIKSFMDYNITLDNYRDFDYGDEFYSSRKKAILAGNKQIKEAEILLLENIENIEESVAQIRKDYQDALDAYNNSTTNSNTYDDNYDYNRNSNSGSGDKECRKCKATGDCQKCNNSRDQSKWKIGYVEYKGWQWDNYNIPGKTPCTTCGGNGRVDEKVDSRKNYTWKKCYVGTCNGGKINCRETWCENGRCTKCDGRGRK